MFFLIDSAICWALARSEGDRGLGGDMPCLLWMFGVLGTGTAAVKMYSSLAFFVGKVSSVETMVGQQEVYLAVAFFVSKVATAPFVKTT